MKLEPPRWKNGPPICEATNLPAFKTTKAMGDFLESLGGHSPVLARWECKECGHWHCWCTAPTDTNGGCLSGSDVLPKRIAKLIEKTKK